MQEDQQGCEGAPAQERRQAAGVDEQDPAQDGEHGHGRCQAVLQVQIIASNWHLMHSSDDGAVGLQTPRQAHFCSHACIATNILPGCSSSHFSST